MNSGFVHAVGQNSNCPPLFDGQNFSSWRSRMEFWIASREPRCLGIIRNGPLLHRGESVRLDSSSEVSFSTEENEIIKLNAMSVNFLHCALSPMEYNRISACTTAKEIWDRLILTHEGTSQVKETRVNLLVQQYEAFKMKSDESITEMYDRLNTIINGLALLGKIYTGSELVRKVLRSLPQAWEAKKTAIEEAKDLTILPLDQLIGSLLSHEEEKRSSGEQKIKSVAFKASASVAEDSDYTEAESDEEISLFAKRLTKFLVKNRFGRSRKPKSFKQEDKKEMVCYECKKPGHLRYDCPQLNGKQKSSQNRKKAFLAWSDEEDDDSEPDEEQKANLCYMAQNKSESDTDEEVFSNSLSGLSPCELEDFFTECLDKFERISSKYRNVKRQNKILQSQLLSLQKGKGTSLKEAQFCCTDASSCSAESLHEIRDLEHDNDKVIHSLKEMDDSPCEVKSQKCHQDGSEYSGSVSYTAQNLKSVFSCDTEQKQKSVNCRRTAQKQKSASCCRPAQNHHRTRSKSFAALAESLKSCHYCGMLGHTIGQCQIKRAQSMITAMSSKNKSMIHGTILKWIPKVT